MGGVAERVVVPELLDQLPATDRRAIRSRSDIARLNRLMGHGRMLARSWDGAECWGRIGRLIDLGVGTGGLFLDFIRRIENPPREKSALLLDRHRTVDCAILRAIEKRGWAVSVIQADAPGWLESLRQPVGTAILSNLFIHQFKTTELARLLELIARNCELFLACEPSRSRRSLWASRWVGLAGCNSITQHDARMSVRAGFRGAEISQLWVKGGDWRLQECSAGLFSHSFMAERAGAAGGVGDA